MKLILTEDHDTLGYKGDIVEVKDGYGRNYLIPRRLAVVATPSAQRRIEEERRQAAHKIEAQRKEAARLAERLASTEIIIPVRVGEENRLFGTVTTQQIAEELAAKGFEIDRRKVTLADDIRTTGEYTATIRISPEHTAEVTVRVVPAQEAIGQSSPGES
ncbi:MAG: 50S ribosomal protein L9 [Rubricoccaceae bacterium]